MRERGGREDLNYSGRNTHGTRGGRGGGWDKEEARGGEAMWRGIARRDLHKAKERK